MEWVSKKVLVSELKPNPSNPRKLSKEQEKHLRKSLEKFGVCEPLIANTDNTLIGGHQRLKTLKKLGHKEVDVLFPKEYLKEHDAKELNIRLNKNVGEWDYDILANEWEYDDLIDWGFSDEELLGETLDEILGKKEEEGANLLHPIENPSTETGDLYAIDCGNIKLRLICGDSTNEQIVKRLLQEDKPILMVTDPPYGVKYDASWRKAAGKGARAIGKVQNDDVVDWQKAWDLFPGDVAYVWHAGKFCAEVQESLEESRFQIVSQIIWVKQHFALSRGDYHWQHEPCWYAVRDKHNWQGSRKESTVWEIANLCAFGKTKDEDERTAHSTQKPLECMARPILNNTKKGESVYDPFLGSGSTMVAALINERNCYGVELDPAYCDMIITRVINNLNKKRLEYELKKNGETFRWQEDQEQI